MSLKVERTIPDGMESVEKLSISGNECIIYYIDSLGDNCRWRVPAKFAAALAEDWEIEWK